MSKRGIQPHFTVHGRHKGGAKAKSLFQTSGLESAQRKRYLRCLEAEQVEARCTKQT